MTGIDELVKLEMARLSNGHATPIEPGAPSRDIDEFLAGVDDDYEWIVPGLLERQERVILTGAEGKGKSTLLRQIALRVASGLHPFDNDTIDAQPVLYVDTENPERIARRKWRLMRDTAGDDYQPGHLRVEFRPDGLNLLDATDIIWLRDRVDANRPRILVIGPLYKLADGDPTKEEIARPVARALDELRHDYDLALLIEAHSPHADGKSKRTLRPYGASLWMRWPEFGIGLNDKDELEHWRGARDERTWPWALERSYGWPWAVRPGSAPPPPQEWNGPTHAADAVVEALSAPDHIGHEYTGNQVIDLVKAAGHAFRSGTVRAGAEKAVVERRIRVKPGPGKARIFWHPAPEGTFDNGK